MYLLSRGFRWNEFPFSSCKTRTFLELAWKAVPLVVLLGTLVSHSRHISRSSEAPVKPLEALEALSQGLFRTKNMLLEESHKTLLSLRPSIYREVGCPLSRVPQGPLVPVSFHVLSWMFQNLSLLRLLSKPVHWVGFSALVSSPPYRIAKYLLVFAICDLLHKPTTGSELHDPLRWTSLSRCRTSTVFLDQEFSMAVLIILFN